MAWPASTVLEGKALDDGLPVPPGTFISIWSQISGPGTVSFTDPFDSATTVTFSRTGRYVLRLSGDDGAHFVTDDMEVLVVEDGAEIVSFEKRVSASADDAEEATAGSVYLTSSDLELVDDFEFVGSSQIVAMRFVG
ncbi:MAG: hypothetical protein P8Y76_13510, partial [bacterium]